MKNVTESSKIKIDQWKLLTCLEQDITDDLVAMNSEEITIKCSIDARILIHVKSDMIRKRSFISLKKFETINISKG
jgi:hypothetical protein